MPIQSALIITAILSCLVGSLLWNFFHKRITAGQTLFWLVLLSGGEILTLFPSLIDRLGVFWGDLWPVSWITFCALIVVLFYLLYLTVRLNSYRKFNDLARSIAYMERRLRELEADHRRIAVDGAYDTMTAFGSFLILPYGNQQTRFCGHR